MVVAMLRSFVNDCSQAVTVHDAWGERTRLDDLPYIGLLT